jgi:hypothetical protein
LPGLFGLLLGLVTGLFGLLTGLVDGLKGPLFGLPLTGLVDGRFDGPFTGLVDGLLDGLACLVKDLLERLDLKLLLLFALGRDLWKLPP